MQYNAALAMTGPIKGTSQTKLCQELGLESLKLSNVRLGDFVPYLKLHTSSGLPKYLFDLITEKNQSHKYSYLHIVILVLFLLQ